MIFNFLCDAYPKRLNIKMTLFFEYE